MFDTLIETEALAAHLTDPDWLVCDCRSSIDDPAAGPRLYAEGHIPGARHLHLERDLSGPVTPETGRHPLPEPQRLARLFAQAGIDAGVQVVAYDDAGGPYAARLWWLLRWLGHTRVAVLNGGWQQWTKEGRPVDKGPARGKARHFPYVATAERSYADTPEILELVLGRKRELLVDARMPARFKGEEETVDPVAGHVPGAVNLPYAGSVAEDGRFRSPAALRQRFEQILGGFRPDQAIMMCGSGVTACHNLLAMELAGLKGARLYAGSWSEWIRDPIRPVARGGE